ncbi:MAG TPA: hypothetical protein VFP63_06580, partial [Dehalococcoidia bacterium]|nr:hypothetical protein [Dehalococcoidia bacterium]
MTAKSTPPATSVAEGAGGPVAATRGLRLFNGLMVPVHFLQGVLMLALSSDYSLPVTTAFLEYDEPAGRLVTDEN